MAPLPQPEPVVINGRQYRPVREGLASILAPYREHVDPGSKKPRNNDEGDQAVFYNPIQQFNRDLSVLAILIYGEGAILEKEAKYGRKQHSRKDKGKKRTSTSGKGLSDSAVTEANVVGVPNGRKRKADQLIEDAALPDNEAGDKKLKTRDADPDEDDLEVMELNGAGLEVPNPVTDVTISNGISKDDMLPSQPEIPKARRTPFTILDALSATGLRALRYAKEIPFATNIVANDLLPDAVRSIELNIDHNQVGKIVHSNVGDARAYMYSKVGNEHQQPSDRYVHRFDVIDLDPYGTAAPFLDSALQAIQDGGLLCVTCTDAGVFASNGYPEKAYALYGGITVKGAHSHEGGLRLILNAVATTASKYGLAIEPLLSLSIDFYARLFIRIHKQPKDVKLLAGTTMIVYSCDYGCGAWNTQLVAKNQPKADKKGDLFYKHGFAQAPSTTPLCEHCGTKQHLGGPMWAGPLHNPYFVQRILDRLPSLDTTTYATTDRLRGMLTVALEEDLNLEQSNTSETPSDNQPDERLIPRLPASTIDAAPFFFIPNYLAKVLHCATPSEDLLRGALWHAGYAVTRSHCKAGSFKTTAPWDVVWGVMLEWVRIKAPIKEGAVREGSPGWNILGRMRGSERRVVREVRGELAEKLGACENVEELRTLVQSLMWRLENGKLGEGVVGVGGAAGSGARKTSVDTAEAGADGTTAPPTVKSLDVVFDENLGKEKPRARLVRYQINPRANWGPMNRAGRGD